MTIFLFLTFFLTALYGIFCKCTILVILSALCLLSSLVSTITPSLHGFSRFLVGSIPLPLLGLFAYYAFRQDALYLERIAEYRYAGLIALIVLLLNVTILLPDKKHTEIPAA